MNSVVQGPRFTVEEITHRVIPVLQKYDVQRAILFGSYAKGTADSESDVDMILDTQRHGFSFMEIYCDIQDALDGIELDLFAFYELVVGGKADREIKRYGKEIYCECKA